MLILKRFIYFFILETSNSLIILEILAFSSTIPILIFSD